MTVSPEHVIGLHFFNPVSRMKLVEVVIAKQTPTKPATGAWLLHGRSESAGNRAR